MADSTRDSKDALPSRSDGKSIDDYRRKRDFSKTPEPAPEAGPRPGAAVFVVHRHEARRLHYDLRLEMEGVLRSWAVPKGFSYDPKSKRLAVRTEDHPIEYEHFEGVIPKGEYGAGTMTIWDRGTYELVNRDGIHGVEKGKLEFRLFGRRLRGEWHLVLTKAKEKDRVSNEWLVFKSSRDVYARTENDQPFSADLGRAKVAKLPRSLRVMKPAAVAEAFSDPDWIFELNFEGIRTLASKRGDEIEFRDPACKSAPSRFPRLVEDLRRVRATQAILDGVLVALDEAGRPSRRVLEACLRGESEGGARGSRQATSKAPETTHTSDGPPRVPLYFYVFDLPFFEEFDLRPVSLLDRKAQLASLLPKSSRGPSHVLYVDHVPASGASLADAVSMLGLTGMIAKRADSKYSAGASKNWREIPVDPDEEAHETSIEEKLAETRAVIAPRDPRIKFTNLDKVYWPEDGTTKGELLAYYDTMADLILPYLKDRPVHMYRFPDGIEGKSFYQHEAPGHTPDWVELLPIPSGSKGRDVPHMMLQDRASLLYLINLGSIDIHPWMSTRHDLDSPTYTVLDLDPKEAPFVDVIKVARAIRKILDAIEVPGYLKTSGSSGLHIFIPLKPGYTYEHGRLFCEGIARIVVREHKEIATIERDTRSRGKKVYVDFQQNHAGQTVVAPYVVRPVPGAQVSTPLHWDELDFDLHPSQFTVRNVPERVSRVGDLYRPVLTEGLDLLEAIGRLQGYVG